LKVLINIRQRTRNPNIAPIDLNNNNNKLSIDRK